MTTATDATQVPGQGVSDAARDAGREIGQPEHVILGTDQGLARDAVEEKAAANARRAAEDRLARMMGLPEGGQQQPEAQQEAGQSQQPAADLDAAGQPRDERGRFAQKEGEGAQAAGQGGQPAAQPTAQQPTPVDLSDDAMVKVKVNGQEQLMRWGDARRSIQIETAARQRMEAAAKKEQEATRLLEEARTKAQAPQQPQQVTTQTQPGQQPAASATDPLEALVDQLAFGDRDGIKSALASFLEQQGARSSQPPAVTPDALTGIVDQRLAAYQQTARAQGELQAFAAEHADIVADEDMQVLVAQRAQKSMQQHLIDIGADPGRVLSLNPDLLGRAYREAEQAAMVPPLMTVFRTSATDVKGKFAGSRQPAAQTAIGQRLADKRAMPMQPTAATVRAPTPQEPRPPTASEIIAAERRERGLTVY